MKVSRYLRNALLAAAMLAIPAASFAGIFISVGIAPPPLPVYVQPAIPAPGYLWTPGYWAWGPGGYYWVPGTWVQPPQVGVLWTPGYWGWGSGAYIFHAGYWGPHIGFYGGVNYGFGYGGVGYEGGYWNHGVFAYNRSVNNITNVHVTNVYNKTVINNTTVNRTSFNGGTGGVQAQPSAQEQAAVRENHFQPTSEQVQHVNQAQNNPQLRASENGGKPAIAATARPGDFSHAEAARQAGGQVNTAAYRAAAANGGKAPQNMKESGAAPANHEAYGNQNAQNHAPEANRSQPAAQNNHPQTEQAHPQNQPYSAQSQAPHAQSQPSYSQPKPQNHSEPKPQNHSEPKPQSHPQEHSKPEHQGRR